MNTPNGWSRASIAYCSNVHPGETLDQVTSNIHTHIHAVRQSRGIDSMASGLWLSAAAASQLQHGDRLQAFRQALDSTSIQLTSLNGFPYGDFHQQRIKQQVYQPDWADSERVQYTIQLADILAHCLPDDAEFGAISTLPLGYASSWDENKQQHAINNLCHVADQLHAIEQRSGKHIVLCIEMEPDCVLEATNVLVEFFSRHLITDNQRRHIGVCYDVCHQAVMHENIADSLQAILDAGIIIGKVQLSSAMNVEMNHADRQQTLSILRTFCEPRYLHQLKTRDHHSTLHSVADLESIFQSSAENTLPIDSNWLIHFHVPIHVEQLLDEHIRTTQKQITQVFDFFRQRSERPLLEVETYTWSALPEALRPADEQALIAGISNELLWVEQQLQHRSLLADT